MADGIRPWLAGAAAFGVIAVLGAAVMSAGGDNTPDLPRVRVSLPGLDNETDLFAEESGSVIDSDPAEVTVTEIDSVEPIRTLFDADHGHPRMILLVDPI